MICDQSAERLAEVARQHPSARTTTDAASLLADPDVDLVSIASYDDQHAAQTIEALARGKHVFVEKPLCLDAGEARAIRAALRPGLVLSSNLILRRSPRFALLRQMIRAGELGAIYHVEAAYHYGRLHKLTHGWRGQRPRYSVVLGGAIHMVDLCLWLTGDTVVEVGARGNALATRGSAFRFLDNVTALLRFTSGMTATVSANFPAVLPHGHGLAVYGTAGTFVNDAPHARLHRARGDAAPEAVTAAHPGADKGELLEGFVSAVLEGTAPEVAPQEIFDALGVCFAIEESCRTSAFVQVNHA
jgi:predicted dehydrogenase